MFSLAIALFLWAYVVVEKQPEMGFLVPVQFKNLPGNLALIQDPQDTEVELRVKGQHSILYNLTSRQFKLIIDLDRIPVGETIFTLTPKNVLAPRGVEIIRLLPPQVKVLLEPQVERLVPIEAVVLGVPAEGFELEGVYLYPDTVKVLGAKSLAEELKSIRTVSISVSGLTSSATSMVDLIQPEGLSLAGPTVAEVRALIQEKTKTKSYRGIPIRVLPLASGAQVEPNTVSLTLRGPISKMRQLKVREILVTANILDLKPGDEELELNFKFPAEITLLRSSPQKVKVITRGDEDQLLRPQIGEELPLPNP